MKNTLKVIYLYNSGFYVETENHILIFDYYLDTPSLSVKGLEHGVVNFHDLKDTNKKIFVFATHSHFDHFNPVIFTWEKNIKNITYVLSSDIKTSHNGDNINFIAPYDSLKLDDITINAFGSTDLGSSFLINVDNVNIFHSGDLNWWDWFDESREYNLEMEKNFKNEIHKIKKHNVDITFFPVDPRLKDKFYLGGEYFINNLHPKYFIPMHFGENFEITKLFSSRILHLDTNIIEIRHRGETFNLNL